MEKIYTLLPNFLQNLLISLFNILSYKKRYGGYYLMYLDLFKKNNSISLKDLKEIQLQKLKAFLLYSKSNSPFYQNLYKTIDLETIQSVADIEHLPIVDKEMLRKEINKVYTISNSNGIKSKTGGTTGKSLEVLFTNKNMQERFAMLDNFRAKSGYKLGKKTAWFSGKNLLTKNDISKKRFWKTDYFYKVRYYSTFHIKTDYLNYYLNDLIKYKPEFIVGFPSSILEIAKYGLQHNFDFPRNTIKAIFPTAETVSLDTKNSLETFFKTKVYDQYASSEGAPFIFECHKNNLHLELQSGVFEVLDNQNKTVNSGKLVVTSFTTYGTPLIRYDIGDSIELSTKSCNCGNNNPLVNQILGRIDDFIYSPENGKINLGNISNTLKDTKGIIKFQAIQNNTNAIEIFVVIDENIFTKEIESIFTKNWVDRVGTKMKIKISYVKKIDTEKSGKYRMVKNNIKHLID